MERLVNSAILYEGIIYQGKRHHNIINENRNVTVRYGIQGFITDTGRFVTREEGLDIALLNGQCSELLGSVLTSEDLW